MLGGHFACTQLRSQPTQILHFSKLRKLAIHYIMNRFLSVVRSRTYKSIELSRAALTVPRYGESNRLVGVD